MPIRLLRRRALHGAGGSDLPSGKLSQNRDPDDRPRVCDALRAQGQGDDYAIADEMERRG